jgi:hypothetical protein
MRGGKMTSKSNYIDEVNRLLARLDGQQQENTEPEPETPIPDTQEPIQDVYIRYVFLEPVADQDEQDIIDSTLIEPEPDTNIPYKPTTQPFTPTIQPLTPEQARDEQTSRHVGLFMISLFLFLCLSSIALQLHFILNPPIATIILIPKSQAIALNATVQLGRVLPPTTLSQEKTVATTGRGHQDARAATGTVTFYNGSNTEQTINAGTVFTGNDGIQVATDIDATIPAANLPVVGQATVPAHALTANAKGNIQAYDINLAVSSDLTVKNLSNFSGGQDARDFQTVTKQDIANAAAPLKTTLAQSMQGALTGQLQSSEALVTPTCTPKISSDHQIGQEATQVHVTVSETCSDIAYNTQDLQSKATQLLTAQAVKKLGSGYSVLGDVQVTTTTAIVTASHPIIAFSCTGVWVYALSNQEQAFIKKMIAGKTTEKALQLLSSLPGIERVSTSWDANTKLPKDVSSIHLAIFYGL